jgi:hypothetical protein
VYGNRKTSAKIEQQPVAGLQEQLVAILKVYEDRRGKCVVVWPQNHQLQIDTTLKKVHMTMNIYEDPSGEWVVDVFEMWEFPSGHDGPTPAWE